jgi:NAD-dependent dihydropyrimidine dehydrogenase PreA subunit
MVAAFLPAPCDASRLAEHISSAHLRAPPRARVVWRPVMPFIIAEPCIGVKDKSCVEVCPVNCIYEGDDQFYIHPDECIDCQACEAACPVQAIFPDNGVPEKWSSFIEKNKVHFENK